MANALTMALGAASPALGPAHSLISVKVSGGYLGRHLVRWREMLSRGFQLHQLGKHGLHYHFQWIWPCWPFTCPAVAVALVCSDCACCHCCLQSFLAAALKCDALRGYVRLHKTPPAKLRVENSDQEQVEDGGEGRAGSKGGGEGGG